MMPETQAMIGRGRLAPPNVFAEGLRPGRGLPGPSWICYPLAGERRKNMAMAEELAKNRAAAPAAYRESAPNEGGMGYVYRPQPL